MSLRKHPKNHPHPAPRRRYIASLESRTHWPAVVALWGSHNAIAWFWGDGKGDTAGAWRDAISYANWRNNEEKKLEAVTERLK